jgi:hypothetical protein
LSRSLSAHASLGWPHWTITNWTDNRAGAEIGCGRFTGVREVIHYDAVMIARSTAHWLDTTTSLGQEVERRGPRGTAVFALRLIVQQRGAMG